MNRLRVALFSGTNAKHLLRIVSRESTFAAASERAEWSQHRPRPTANQSHAVRENFDHIKVFPQRNENEYIYKYIHGRLRDRFRGIEQKVENLPINQYIVKIKELVREEPKNKEQIRKVGDEIKSQIQYMNQVELTALLRSLKDQQKELSNLYWVIIRFIDIEFRWLLKNNVKTRLMDLDLWLYVADLFFECGITHWSKFTYVLVNYLTNEPEVEMTNKQVLHLLFLIVLKREQASLLKKFEPRIFKLLNNATFEDLSIICMAYFKTRTQIKDPQLLGRIIDSTSEYLETLDPLQPGFCSILKSVRYSNNLSCRNNVMHMVLSLTEGVNQRIIFASPYNAVHCVKLMETYRIYDPKFLDMFRHALFKDLDKFRIKDIQYALTSLSNLAYMDLSPDDSLRTDFKKLATQIVREKRKDVGYQYYHLLAIMRAFAIFGYYDDGLIAYTNKVLADRDQLRKIEGMLEFDKSTLIAYIATNIESKGEKLRDLNGIMRMLGSRIIRHPPPAPIRPLEGGSSLEYLSSLLRGNEEDLPFTRRFRRIAVDLSRTDLLKDPKYKFYFQYTMPHANYNDMVITNSVSEVGSFDPHSMLPRQVPKNEKHCMIYAVKFSDFLDGHSRLSGYKQTVMRLAGALGYHVLPVDLNDPDIDGLARRVKSVLDGH